MARAGQNRLGRISAPGATFGQPFGQLRGLLRSLGQLSRGHGEHPLGDVRVTRFFLPWPAGDMTTLGVKCRRGSALWGIPERPLLSPDLGPTPNDPPIDLGHRRARGRCAHSGQPGSSHPKAGVQVLSGCACRGSEPIRRIGSGPRNTTPTARTTRFGPAPSTPAVDVQQTTLWHGFPGADTNTGPADVGRPDFLCGPPAHVEADASAVLTPPPGSSPCDTPRLR